MQTLTRASRPVVRAIAWTGSALAWLAAGAVGAVMAMVLAVTVVTIAVMGSLVVTLAGAGLRARRVVRRRADPQLIEARRIGGHSWVAYGWDGPA
ncbi:MAG TPA: hypothetical protein VII73_08930 [Caulobacteraceae bacterium]